LETKLVFCEEYTMNVCARRLAGCRFINGHVASRRKAPIVAWLLGAWLLAFAPTASAQQLVPLVTDETPLPWSGVFGTALAEAINPNGDFAFQGKSNQAMFLRRAGGPLVRVLQMNDEVPGFPGSRADLIFAPHLNNAGLLAFTVECFQENGRPIHVIFTFDGVSLRQVVSGLDTAPGSGGSRFERDISLIDVNDAGDVAFTATLVASGSGLPARTTLFIAPGGGAPVRVAGLEDAAPGTAGATFASLSPVVFGLSSPGINGPGEVLFSANLTGGTGGSGLFVGSASGVRKVVSTGDPNPLGGAFAAPFSAGRLNNAGQVAFSNGGALWVNSLGTGHAAVGAPGTPVPAPLGGTFGSSPGLFWFDDAGELAFTQTVVGSAVGGNGLFRFRPGNPIDVVAYRNQSAPGVAGKSFAVFSAVSMNGGGLISFRATDVTTQALIGFFQQSGSGLPLNVVLDGQASALPGGGTYRLASSTNTQTLDNGAVYFWADILGGVADYGEFLVSAGGTVNLMSTADPLPAGARVVERTFRVGAAGDYVGFLQQPAGGRSSLFQHDIVNQVTTLIATDGDLAPESGGGRLTLTNTNAAYVNESGQVAFAVSILGGSANAASGILLFTPGSGVAKLVLNNDVDPVGGTVGSVSMGTAETSPINSAGQVVFTGGGSSGRMYVGTVGSGPFRIAAVGSATVGAGAITSLVSTGDASINPAGLVALRANTAAGTAIFVGAAGGPPVKVAAVGDPAPGGGTFAAFGTPVLNSSGEVLFGATVSGGAGGGVFLGSTSAPPVAVALGGDAAPTGGIFAFPATLSDVAMNDQHDVVFRASVTGGPADSGIFMRRGLLGAIEPVVVQGQPAPGSTGVFAPIVAGINGQPREDLQLGPAGDLTVQASFTEGGLLTRGLWHVKTDGTLEDIQVRGTIAPEFGGGTAVLTSPSMGWNAGGRYPMRVRVSGGTFIEGLMLFVPSVGTATPVGASIVVAPHDTVTGTSPVTVTFFDVTGAGETSVTTSAAGPALPSAFQLGDPPMFYNLATTAVFDGAITVCVDFGGASFPAGADLRLLHFEGGAWHDVTTSGPTGTVICGMVTSLSPFTIARLVDQAPVANAGSGQVLECCAPAGNPVTLNGSASSDPDGDALTYVWTDGEGQVVGHTASVGLTLPRGDYTFTLTVTDPYGKASSAATHVTVEDTVAPTLAVTMTPSVIWPPDNKLVTVVATIQVSDACDASPRVALVSITSNEALAAGDIQGAAFGTDDRTFQVRAKRAGRGTGRTYTITYRVTDAAGNSTEQQVQVVVPHDQGAGFD
jgi:hypothetical protein